LANGHSQRSLGQSRFAATPQERSQQDPVLDNGHIQCSLVWDARDNGPKLRPVLAKGHIQCFLVWDARDNGPKLLTILANGHSQRSLGQSRFAATPQERSQQDPILANGHMQCSLVWDARDNGPKLRPVLANGHSQRSLVWGACSATVRTPL
jgi:hypothetical protein